jgi:hypothetical protein
MSRSGADGCDADARRVHQVTLVSVVNARSSLPGLLPRLALTRRQLTALRLPSSLFEVDCLTVERAEIYVGRSRHWAVAWLWFLS